MQARDFLQVDDNYALLIWGRRLEADTLKAQGITQGQVSELASYLQSRGLVYAHQGTTDGWGDNPEAVPALHLDAIVGQLIAVANPWDEDEEGSGPVRVERPQLEGLSLEADLWAEVERRFGVKVAGQEDGLFLAVAGWSIAYLYPGDAEFDEEEEDFDEDFEPFEGTSAEDLPPAQEMDPAKLPDAFWLSATYL